MLNLMDIYVGGFSLLIIGMIELIVIVYIYGLSYESEQTKTYPMRLLRGFLHFRSNIEMMLGSRMIIKVSFYFFGITWCFISPVVLLLVVILKAQQYEPIKLESYVYPEWANVLGWLIVLFCVVLIPGWMIYFLITKDISMQCRPGNTWGPSQMAKQEWSFFVHPFKRTRTHIDFLDPRPRAPRQTKSEAYLYNLDVQKDSTQMENIL